MWPELDKTKWEMINEYDQFYQHWRSKSSSEFPKKFPYVLELGADERGRSFIRFRPYDTTKGQILVIESYENIFQRILGLREEGAHRGIVLCGQPGTGKSQSPDLHLCGHSVAHPLGKSTFLMFLLARLISARQVVIFGNRNVLHLFYHGKVYRKMQFLQDLPTLFRNEREQPAWALIDGDGMAEVPFSMDTPIWPILATSPQPIRWQSWGKQLNAYMWGMPKWNFEELVAWYA